MFKKILACVATLGLALGMVGVTATAANAHYSTVNATITCTTDYKYQVDWSITNSESGYVETIIDSSDTVLVPENTTVIPMSGTSHFYEIMDSPTAKTLTVTGSWTHPDNTVVIHEDSGSIKKNDFPNCTPNHVPVTICHATPPDTAAQGWESNTVDDDAIVNSGHNQQHAKDIIPAFNYWESVNDVWTLLSFPGKNLATNFSGFTGAQILQAGCVISVTPGTVTFASATCTAPGVIAGGSYTIPSTPGVQYSVRLNNTGGYVDTPAGTTVNLPVGTVIDVKATGVPSWVTLTGTKAWNYTVLDASPASCIYISTPVAPTVTPITLCGTYGSVVPQATPGVVYTLTTGDGKQGAYVITATPAFGYHFVGPQSVEFPGDLGTYTDCAAPVAPTVTPITECGTYGSVVPKVTPGVVYTLTTGDGKQGAFVITATPAPGYSFVGPQSVEFPGDLGTYTKCVTPIKVDFFDAECTRAGNTQATYSIPEKTGVQYSVSTNGAAFIDTDDGSYNAYANDVIVVKATAMPGYTIQGTKEWEHTFIYDSCLPTLADYEVSLGSANQVCTPSGNTSGSITVSVIPGPPANPVPALFYLNKGTPGQQLITGTTALAPGNYTVTAEAKLPGDGVYGTSTGSAQPDGTWLWNVTIASASAAPCSDLPTLAFTGSTSGLVGLELAGGLVVLGALGVYFARRKVNAAV
jgi:hypothetical protein